MRFRSACSATGSGRQDVVEFGCDFRLARRAGQTADADGLAIAYLPVSRYGSGGPGPQVDIEADVAGALGIGFDTFDNTGGTDHNTISIHLDGTRLVNDIAPGIVMANGDWTHARLRLERTEGGTLLTIELTPAGGGAVVAVEDYFLPGFDLEAGRLLPSASQGTNTSNQIGRTHA